MQRQLGMVLTVSRFMTKQPHTIERTASLAEAHRLMRLHDIRHLPVLDHGKLVGIVSRGDLHLLETVAEFSLDEVEVNEAMTPNLYVVSGDAALDDVVETMARHKYGSAIITSSRGVEGIFTTIDAMHVLANVLRRDQLNASA